MCNRKGTGSSFGYDGGSLGEHKHCDEVILLMKDATLAPDLIVCILLNSLPAEVSMSVSTISGQDSANLKLEAVRIRAITEEVRLRRTECKLVLYPKYKRPVNNVIPVKREALGRVVKCCSCVAKGHYVKTCPIPKYEVAAVVHEVCNDVG